MMGFDLNDGLDAAQGIIDIVKQVEKPDSTGIEKFALAAGLAKKAFPKLEEEKVYKGINIAVDLLNILGIFKK